MPKRFQNYSSIQETLSILDVISRRSIDPIFIPVYEDGVDGPVFVEFYALKWSGQLVKENRGMGHGRVCRGWTFRGLARRAVGGTVSDLEWGGWVEAKGSFVEDQPGLFLQMRA